MWAAGFGGRVRAMRADIGISLAEATKLWTHGALEQTRLSELERGVSRLLNAELLSGLLEAAVASGHSIVWLMTGRGDPNQVDNVDIAAAAAPALGVLEGQLRRARESIDRLGRAAGGTLRADALTDAEVTAEFLRRNLIGPAQQRIQEFIQTTERAFIPPERVSASTGTRRRPQTSAGDLAGPPVTVSSSELPAAWSTRFVPVVTGVSAGLLIRGGKIAVDEYVEAPGAPDGACAVRVVGRSMLPRFAPGDILVLDPQRPARSGEAAVVIYKDDGGDTDTRAVLKLWCNTGRTVRLASLDTAVPPLILKAEAVLKVYGIWKHLPLHGRAKE